MHEKRNAEQDATAEKFIRFLFSSNGSGTNNRNNNNENVVVNDADSRQTMNENEIDETQ